MVLVKSIDKAFSTICCVRKTIMRIKLGPNSSSCKKQYVGLLRKILYQNPQILEHAWFVVVLGEFLIKCSGRKRKKIIHSYKVRQKISKFLNFYTIQQPYTLNSFSSDPHENKCSMYYCVFWNANQKEERRSLIAVSGLVLYNTVPSCSCNTRSCPLCPIPMSCVPGPCPIVE